MKSHVPVRKRAVAGRREEAIRTILKTAATAKEADSEAVPAQTPVAAAKPAPAAPVWRGPARLGKRTKELTGKLAPGALVILDHADLDSVAATQLVRRRPVVVINNRPFVTGRYPNRGPGVLLAAGIALFDIRALPSSENNGDEEVPAPDLFALLEDGEAISVSDDTLTRTHDNAPIARLFALTPDRLESLLVAARDNLDSELVRFAQNTLRYLERSDERALLLDPVDIPPIAVPLAGRHVLVVVRGDGYEEDLDRLRPYLREQKPAIIAVDGAADALLARGLRPHLILGDMDSISDSALRCGAELVVHAYARSRDDTNGAAALNAPGLARVEALGLPAHTFPVAGTSEDAALLLAHEKGADLIVAVGTHTNLEDFLDKGRGGMASAFLVRLKVGSRLVDARGVSRLYAGRQKLGPLLFYLTLSALFPLCALLAATPSGQVAWRAVAVWFRLLSR